MSNGRNHYLAANYTAVIAGAATYIIVPESAFMVAAGLLIGKYATSDVRDQQAQKNYGESAFAKDFGETAGKAFTALWWPLACLIPHRHILSHLPGLSTAVAALWLFLPILVGLYAWQQPNDVLSWAQSWILSVGVLWLLAGWAVQDFVHWVMDGLPIKF